MALGDFSITFGAYTATFDKFSGEQLPRSVLGQASLEFSQLGAGYATGPAKKQRKIWTVAAYASEQTCLTTLTLFDAWDTQRALGKNTAEVAVYDELFGSAVSANAFFSTAPAISLIGPGNNITYLISFGLTEV